MIVECPTCHTRYRLDDALVAGKDPLLQCSFDNCLFRLPFAAAAGTGSLRSLTDASLRSSPANEEPDPTQKENQLLFSLPDLSTAPESGSLDKTQDRLALQEQEEPLFILPPTEPISFSLRSFFVFFAVVALCYGAFSLYLSTNPVRTGTFLGAANRVRLPLVGKLFVADQLFPRKINLINLKGRYQQIKDNKQAFIISGQAVNTAPVTVHSIQVEGRIFNGNGGEVGRKIIFCGNEISIKVVENLSSQEISILQKLVPPKHFGVPPGKAASFLIIFTNPPADIKEFSCRVVTARNEG
jgi:predicted Zn finger-like uncharacterized protein